MQNEQTEKPEVATSSRPRRKRPGSARVDRVEQVVIVTRWWLSIIPVVLGIFVTIFLFYESFINKRAGQSAENTLGFANATQISKLIAEQDAKIQPLISQINQLEKHLSSLSNIPKEDALNIQLQTLQNSVTELTSREVKIESVILENPAKALEMPLLRRDLDNVKESQQATLVSLKESVDRIYDLNKWLLGAMAVSIVTLAAGNLLKPKETTS